jgi:GAF domain-containing protein
VNHPDQHRRQPGTVADDATGGVKQLERRMTFLADLGQALQPLTDPHVAMATAARMLGEHLGVDRCAYAEVEADEDHFVLTGDYTRGDTASIVGRYAMSAFGAEALRLMREDLPYVVDDVLADPRVTPSDRAAYEQTQIRAVISMPLHKAGRFVAGWPCTSARPGAGSRRRWSC